MNLNEVIIIDAMAYWRRFVISDKAIQKGNEELFLELREKELIKGEREFMESKGVRPSNILSPQEPLIDTE